MRLTINDRAFNVASVEDAQSHWETVRGQQFSDVWLDAGESGPSLCMLVNVGRAFLLYLRDHEGDTGYSSRNPDYAGPPDAVMVFELANGQRDEYPMSWTIPLEDAIAACAYFIATQGGRSGDTMWHDDAVAGER